MNKAEYEEKSRKLKLPCKCPLVGKCMRWAETVYQCETMDAAINPRPIQDTAVGYLISEGRITAGESVELLPIVTADREWPGASMSRDRVGDRWSSETVYRNVCPDYTLHAGFTLPGSKEPVAIKTAWIVDDSEGHVGAAGVVTSHFSECLEFIRHQWERTMSSPASKRQPISPRLRFSILHRDGFKCVYCGASKDDGVRLEADHKISVKDGGTNDPSNLVASCRMCNGGKGAKSVG